MTVMLNTFEHGYYRTAKSNSARDKADLKMNIDVRKEDVIDIELKEGK